MFAKKASISNSNCFKKILNVQSDAKVSTLKEDEMAS